MAKIYWHSFSLHSEWIPSRKQQQQQQKPSKCWWGCKEKRAPISIFVECKLVQPLCKSLWRFLKNKFKAGFPYDPILGIYPKGPQSALPQKCCIQTYQCSTIWFSLLLSAIELLHFKKYMIGEYRSSGIIVAESLNIYFKGLGFNTD
jgi:hypothetical protein